MDYLFISDCMWYIGHISTGISVFTRSNFYLTAFLVVFGQSITIISRPIGRIQNITKTDMKHDEEQFI